MCDFARELERENAALRDVLMPFLLMRPDGDIGWRGQNDARCGWVLVKHILAIENAFGRDQADAAIDAARKSGHETDFVTKKEGK